MKNFLNSLKTLSENPFKALFIVALFTIAAYSNVFPNGFVLDDMDFIVDWPLIQDLKNLPYFFINYDPPAGQEGIYSPLKTLIHAVNYNLFGLNPTGYHVVAVLIHLLGTLYVYKIMFLLTKSRYVSFLGSLFFGTHPIHANIVINLTGSVDVFGIVFSFMSFYHYLRANQKPDSFSRKQYIFSLLFAVLAVFTHELTISLPVLIFWYEFCYHRKERAKKEMFFRVLPFFVIVFLYVLAKYFVLGAIIRGRYINDSFYLTMLVIVKSWAKYVLISFFPLTLTHNHIISKGIYSYAPDDFDRFAVLSQSIFEPQFLFSTFLIVVIILSAFHYRNKNVLITFSIGWFFICLLPVSNLIPSGVYFAERYLYPGSLAFCLLTAVFVQFLERINWLRAACGTVIILTVFYTGRTWARSWDFRNEITLFESAVRANPQSALLRNDLGIAYIENQMFDHAIGSIKTAISMTDNDPEFYFSLADAYLGKEDKQQAIAALSTAVTLNPEFPEAYYNLASIHALENNVEEAKRNLGICLRLLRQMGREDDAAEYEEAFYEFFGPNFITRP